jgi:hypothetical protein
VAFLLFLGAFAPALLTYFGISYYIKENGFKIINQSYSKNIVTLTCLNFGLPILISYIYQIVVHGSPQKGGELSVFGYLTGISIVISFFTSISLRSQIAKLYVARSAQRNNKTANTLSIIDYVVLIAILYLGALLVKAVWFTPKTYPPPMPATRPASK